MLGITGKVVPVEAELKIADNKSVRKVVSLSILLSFFAFQAMGNLCGLNCEHHGVQSHVEQNETPPCHGTPEKQEEESSKDCCSAESCFMDENKDSSLLVVVQKDIKPEVEESQAILFRQLVSGVTYKTGPSSDRISVHKSPLYILYSQLKIPFLNLA